MRIDDYPVPFLRLKFRDSVGINSFYFDLYGEDDIREAMKYIYPRTTLSKIKSIFGCRDDLQIFLFRRGYARIMVRVLSSRKIICYGWNFTDNYEEKYVLSIEEFVRMCSAAMRGDMISLSQVRNATR